MFQNLSIVCYLAEVLMLLRFLDISIITQYNLTWHFIEKKKAERLSAVFE